MIQFKELRVSPDGKNLIIDAEVKPLEYYNDVYIDAIIIDSQDTYVSNGSSTQPIFSYEETSDKKRIRLELNSTALGVLLHETLFFVYVVTRGTPSSETPCGMDNQTTMGVVADLYPFYRSMVNCMKEVENDCEIPRNFINSILRFKALDLCIKTGHYTQAIKYWNKFFKRVKTRTANSECRCYGQT